MPDEEAPAASETATSNTMAVENPSSRDYYLRHPKGGYDTMAHEGAMAFVPLSFGGLMDSRGGGRGRGDDLRSTDMFYHHDNSLGRTPYV